MPRNQPAIDKQFGAHAIARIIRSEIGGSGPDIVRIAGALGGIDPEANVILLAQDI